MCLPELSRNQITHIGHMKRSEPPSVQNPQPPMLPSLIFCFEASFCLLRDHLLFLAECLVGLLFIRAVFKDPRWAETHPAVLSHLHACMFTCFHLYRFAYTHIHIHMYLYLIYTLASSHTRFISSFQLKECASVAGGWPAHTVCLTVTRLQTSKLYLPLVVC